MVHLNRISADSIETKGQVRRASAPCVYLSRVNYGRLLMNLDRDSLIEPISDTQRCNVRANHVVENKWRRTALARGARLHDAPMRPRSPSKKICAELFLCGTKAPHGAPTPSEMLELRVARFSSPQKRRKSDPGRNKCWRTIAPRPWRIDIAATCKGKRRVRLLTRTLDRTLEQVFSATRDRFWMISSMPSILM